MRIGLRGWNISWTSPRTAVTGEIYTAAILNTDVRDNLRYLKGMDGTVQIQDGLELTGTGTASYLKPPVLTTTQRDAIVSPANGMVIFNSTDVKLQKYEGTWRSDMAYGGTLTYLSVPSMATGDIFYADTGTSIARLPAGTSGFVLKTQGLAVPVWAALPQDPGVGTVIIGSADIEAASGTITAKKFKELRIWKGGTLTLSWTHRHSSLGEIVFAQAYRNNTAVGTLYQDVGTAEVNVSQNIGGWEIGDKAQLYGYVSAVSTGYWKLFRVKAASGNNNSDVILDSTG